MRLTIILKVACNAHDQECSQKSKLFCNGTDKSGWLCQGKSHRPGYKRNGWCEGIERSSRTVRAHFFCQKSDGLFEHRPTAKEVGCLANIVGQTTQNSTPVIKPNTNQVHLLIPWHASSPRNQPQQHTQPMTSM